MTLTVSEPGSRTVCLINGSPSGDAGNTARLLAMAARYLERKVSVVTLTLAEGKTFVSYEPVLSQSSAFVFGSGTYWDSWGSPLQRFLEEATSSEGTDLWLGKPVGTIITMGSVGGKGVLSRLQGVLNTFGALIPPMSGFVYSHAAHLALRNAETCECLDIWQPKDIEIVCHNLLEATVVRSDWKRWDVDTEHFNDVWLGEELLSPKSPEG